MAQQGPWAAPPPAEVSTIVVPIRASLAPLAAEVEKRAPKTFDGDAKERGIDIHYEVARDPIRLQMAVDALHASTSIHYAMRACRGRFPCVSCGFKEARREAQITLETKLLWDASWRLRSSTKLLPVSYPKPCGVTWFDIDITRRFVAPVVEQQLGETAKIIDHNTPLLTNLKPRAEQIWNALQTPTELAPRTWLVLDPFEVALSPIGGSGSMAMSTLALRARTRVVVGEKPLVSRKPLPALRADARVAQPLVRVPFDLELSYDDASRLASRDYAGKTYKVNGKTLIIDAIRIAPAPNGRVLVEATIDYRGGALRNYKGVVFLEGTPRFDAATSAIVVPDLDYSLAKERRGFFSRIAERAAHDSIRQRLRDSARFPLGARITTLRDEVSRALTRTLAPGVIMKGRAQAIEPESVTPLAHAISLKVIASGEVSIDLR